MAKKKKEKKLITEIVETVVKCPMCWGRATQRVNKKTDKRTIYCSQCGEV